MNNQNETFWGAVWQVLKKPSMWFAGSPLTQSIAAFCINLCLLWIAVLAQFWVFFSAVLLGVQAFDTWLVSKGRMSKLSALSVGLLLVMINWGSLALAVLAQFWVIASTILASWQYVNLIRVCSQKK